MIPQASPQTGLAGGWVRSNPEFLCQIKKQFAAPQRRTTCDYDFSVRPPRTPREYFQNERLAYTTISQYQGSLAGFVNNVHQSSESLLLSGPFIKPIRVDGSRKRRSLESPVFVVHAFYPQ